MYANKFVKIVSLGEKDLYHPYLEALVGLVGQVDAFGLFPTKSIKGYFAGGITTVDNHEFYYFSAVQVEEVPNTGIPDNIVLGYN